MKNLYILILLLLPLSACQKKPLPDGTWGSHVAAALSVWTGEAASTFSDIQEAVDARYQTLQKKDSARASDIIDAEMVTFSGTTYDLSFDVLNSALAGPGAVTLSESDSVTTLKMISEVHFLYRESSEKILEIRLADSTRLLLKDHIHTVCDSTDLRIQDILYQEIESYLFQCLQAHTNRVEPTRDTEKHWHEMRLICPVNILFRVLYLKTTYAADGQPEKTDLLPIGYGIYNLIAQDRNRFILTHPSKSPS